MIFEENSVILKNNLAVTADRRRVQTNHHCFEPFMEILAILPSLVSESLEK